MDNTDDTSNDTHMANEATEESISKQFLLTLNTPRIIFVADSSTNPSDIMSLTLFMSHLNYLRERNSVCEKQSLFCDGLEIFTGGAKNPAPCSSLLCPLSISGSLAKTALGENNPQCLSGWVWAEELQARAAYSDLTSAIDVFNGIKKQIEFSKVQTKITTNTTISGETSATCNGGDVFRREGPPSQTMLNIEAVCDGVNLVVTDDSCRHFANAQPLIDASLIGLRFSRVDSLPVKENHDRDITSKTFISLDSLELLDLLQPPNSPFRLIATSSQANPDNVMCSPHSQKKLDTMSWDSYRMIESSDWGFQMAASMKRRQDAIHQLASRDSYFDGSSESLEVETLMALRKVSHQNGTTYVDFNFQHLTVQWNPSTIIALQRFLGRMKKATYLLSERTSTTVAADTEACQGVSSQNFSLNASIGSVSLCLNKEYQQRQLLDALIIGVQMKFDRFQDNSLLLQGSIKSLRAWDPDTSKSTSDRNRFILQVVKDAVTTAENETQSSGYFFHFQYRTFSLGFSHDSKSTPLPVWIEEKASSGDIDHALSIKMGRVEFNHLRERTAELLDYLNNGLPGKGMGATSKAAQSFCADRIKKRSFLDLFIDHPQVFIPRSPSSTIGGCYLSLGNLSVKSWFEEARAFDNLDDFSVLDGTQRPSTMDWWRVLILNLNIGMSTEVDHCVLGPSSANTLLDACITMRKPMYGKTTLIKGNISPTNVWSLKYREFRVLNLVLHENIGKSIDESKWENLEKSYWQNEDKIFPDGNAAKNLTYADSARFVRFGEAKPVAKDGSQLSIRISIESINITLHRDDWFDNLDEENVAFLCYDICNFAVSKMESSIIVCSNKDITTSISLHGISFTDIGNYGRLARDIYVDNNNQNRPPCAFAVIAEGYGQSTEEPLVSITFTRKEGAKNVEFKVNSLSITVLPRYVLALLKLEIFSDLIRLLFSLSDYLLHVFVCYIADLSRR